VWNPLASKTPATNNRAELIALLKEAVPRARSSRALTDATELRELGVDSLGLVMLVVQFCERYGFDPSTLGSDVEAIRTVGQVLELGERMLSARAEVA
jgi:acyl carrier protein